MFVPIIQFLINQMMEIKNLNIEKFDKSDVKHDMFDDAYDVLTFLRTFKNYIDIDKDPLAVYTFGLFKIKMSESIFILVKEPYFANIFNKELPFLEELLL